MCFGIVIDFGEWEDRINKEKSFRIKKLWNVINSGIPEVASLCKNTYSPYTAKKDNYS